MFNEMFQKPPRSLGGNFPVLREMCDSVVDVWPWCPGSVVSLWQWSDGVTQVWRHTVKSNACCTYTTGWQSPAVCSLTEFPMLLFGTFLVSRCYSNCGPVGVWDLDIFQSMCRTFKVYQIFTSQSSGPCCPLVGIWDLPMAALPSSHWSVCGTLDHLWIVAVQVSACNRARPSQGKEAGWSRGRCRWKATIAEIEITMTSQPRSVSST